MKLKSFSLAAGLSAVFLCSVVAQNVYRFPARVRVVVSCEDDSLKNQLSSFLNRELRTVGDATIVDDKPDLVLRVFAAKMHGGEGMPTGVAVALHISEPYNTEMLTDCSAFPDSCLTGKIEDLRLRVIKSSLTPSSRSRGDGIWAVPLDDVRSLCQHMIADFDATVLEPDRKFWKAHDKAK